MEAELIAGIGVQVGEMHSKVMRGDPKPVYKPRGNTFTVPAGATGGQFSVSQGSPSRGRVWNILKIVILGADAHTSLANVIVDVYAGTEVDSNTPPSQDSLILSGGTGNVPSITFYSKKVEWCSSGEEVIAAVYGATPGQTITVICRVAEYNVEDVEAVRV